jgi:hypothetical protein
MSLFPFDIAKIRQHSEQNKLFADFRRDYMRHGSQFVTNPPQAPISCRVEPAGFGSDANGTRRLRVWRGINGTGL